MEVEIVKYSVGSALKAKMKEGEYIYTEPGALIGSKGELEIDSSVAGGLITGAMRMLGGGESAFINKVIARSAEVEAYFAPSLPSDIIQVKMENEEYILGDGAYLAHTGNISLSTKLRLVDGLISGYGFLLLKAEGSGDLFLSGEGSIIELNLQPGEIAIVDNTNFLATNAPQMEKIRLATGIKSLLFGGEGIGFRIRGPAKVLIRTNSVGGLAEAILRYIKT
ncbi:MAG: TIGR00266 family protein [Candidatus Micrarchaeota archaeon]|nr:TIGR00266 family protein [Candidatus Micrarchaeota archaeon]